MMDMGLVILLVFHICLLIEVKVHLYEPGSQNNLYYKIDIKIPHGFPFKIIGFLLTWSLYEACSR